MLTAMDQALKWDLLKKNPVALTRPPKIEREKMEAYSAAQTAVLLDELRNTRIYRHRCKFSDALPI